jgi:hypothetical protein
MDFEDHKAVVQARSDSQEVDHDRREIMREVNSFVTNKAGQWEQSIWDRFGTFGRPRYTFDRTKPILNQIWGEIADNEFAIRFKPMGGGADKDTAEVMDGLARKTQNISNGEDVFEQCAKKSIAVGFAAWRVEQDWLDVDSFEQDIFIRPIHNVIDRLWPIGYFQQPTAEDADAWTLDHLVSLDEFKERFGEDRSPMALGQDRSYDEYYYKREGILISELIYKQPVTKTLYLSPEGDILGLEDAEKEAQRLKVPLDDDRWKSRERTTYEICTRFYDGSDWLTEPEKTVFDCLPIVPIYPNFEIVDNKVITCGAIEWLMDEQRVHNYAVSTAVEDVALSPKPKTFMTKEQAAGHEKTLRDMNVSNSPVQFYNQVEGQNPPYQVGRAGPNPAVSELIGMTAQAIQASSNMFEDSMARSPQDRSGVAIERVQHKGDIGQIEYFKALERAMIYTGKILSNVYPKLYTDRTVVQILREDGEFEEVTLYEQKLDEEQGVYTINDLSKGSYSVVCAIGPSYANKQEQSADKIIELGAVDPAIVQSGQDVLLRNIDTPGMDILADRARSRLMKMGEIPESQWTDEEREQAEMAAQQPPPPDPAAIIAEAEMGKAEAQQTREEIRSQSELIKLQQSQQKMDFDQAMQQLKIQQQEREIDLKRSQEEFGAVMQAQEQTVNMLKTMAETLNTLRESMGADAVVSPSAAQAYGQQAEAIAQTQDDLQRS